MNENKQTNEMGTGEYRSHRLLQYSFEKMLGKKIDKIENLQQEITEYFVNSGLLTKEDISNTVKKLTGKD